MKKVSLYSLGASTTSLNNNIFADHSIMLVVLRVRRRIDEWMLLHHRLATLRRLTNGEEVLEDVDTNDRVHTLTVVRVDELADDLRLFEAHLTVTHFIHVTRRLS